MPICPTGCFVLKHEHSILLNFLGSQKVNWLPSGFSEPKREPVHLVPSGPPLSWAGSVSRVPLH